MARLSGAFDRLSRREKILVGTMVALVAGLLVAGVGFFLGSRVGELEEQVTEHRAALRKIYARSGDFLEARAQRDRLQALAAQNETMNLKLAVNEIAKTISFQARDRRGEPEGMKKLADVMQFDQTQETFLSKKKKRASTKKDAKVSDVGYYRRDQPITLSDNVPFKAVYELLEKIEESDRMLLVTDMELSRDFQDGRIARKNATIVVSTFYYKGGGEE